MRRKTKLPELLAPAGSFEALTAAISGGADAIYIGGKSFGARAYAKNFDIEEIKRAAELCHIHGVKLYATVNTLVFDRELSDLSDYVFELYCAGIDALICADLGAIAEIRRRVPDMPIHASTQMCVHNTAGADAASELGCERVVVARELSKEDIIEVVENSKTEVEVFLHGALCVCHSGQCLMSSLVGGRSGNRGECAQPCRLPYGKGYPLSLKDLSLASHIKSLVESGVASLKIEGRMKSPSYVYRVTKIYRTLLDEMRGANKSEEEELKKIFSRGGFTDGYYKKKLGAEMLGVRSGEDKEESRALTADIPAPSKIKLSAKCKIVAGENASLTLISKDKSATVYTNAPRPAESSPLTAEGVKSRLAKLGQTPFVLNTEDIDITLEEGLNLSPGEINALRRAAVDALLKTNREPPKTEKFARTYTKKQTKIYKTAYFYNPKVLDEVKENFPSLLVQFDKIFVPLFLFDELRCDGVGVALPPVILPNEEKAVRDMLSRAKEKGVTNALISNLSHKAIAEEYGFSVMGDFRLNVTNSLSAEEWKRMGANALILSPELTVPMARDIGGSVIVYGRIPLMLTERCFIKDSFGCDKCGKASLTDRTGAKFPMLREFEHRNIILNSTPTYMGDKADELSRAGLNSHHFIFTVESAKEITDILSAYKNKKPLPYAVRRMGKR